MEADGRLGLRDVVDLLREDIRGMGERFQTDLRESERRLSAELAQNRTAFLSYQADHLGVHQRRAADTDAVHAQIQSRVEGMVLVEAKRAGAVAVGLVVIRTLGQNWQALAALAAALAALTGAIHISIGVSP